MGQFKLCKSDSLLELLKDTFNANPVRVPETRILPLCAVAKTKKAEKFIGRIENLLSDTQQYSGTILESDMANVSAKKSSAVDFELGFKIMDGFLQGMGATGASIKGKLSSVEKISFSFKNVKRKWIDLGELGNFLTGKKLNSLNPVNNQFFSGDSICVVIDSVIVSNNFTINVEKSSDTNFSIDIEALNQSLGNTDISISSNSNTEISFKGKEFMAFAFTSTSFQISDEGIISFKPAEPESMFLTTDPNEDIIQTIFTPNRVLLYEDFGLIEFDE